MGQNYFLVEVDYKKWTNRGLELKIGETKTNLYQNLAIFTMPLHCTHGFL